MTNKKKETAVTKNKGGAPTKYTKELAEKFTDDLAYMTIKQACKKNGISEDTYYRWLHKHKELSEFSTRARETRANLYYDKAAEVVELIEDPKGQFECYLRLAGKANQGLYGDKGLVVNNNTQINNTINTEELIDEKLLKLINVNKEEK